jgi:hypothetical protein
MPGFSSIPEPWLSDPPTTLVIGDGPYAQALALVYRSAMIGTGALLGNDQEAQEGGLPLVLRDLSRVLILSGPTQSTADILGCHAALWRWIEKLSPEGDQHEVAILFVLPQTSGNALEEAISLGLGFENLDPTSGHGIARMGDSLGSLCRALSAIRPCDLPPLRTRQAGNIRHKAIRQLIDANCAEDLAKAAEVVTNAFKGQEYHLDLFCRPPSHRNGNQLRQWLQEAVTDGVTPDSSKAARFKLAEWLRTE